VVTEKGYGFEPAEEDPAAFHTPAPFSRHNGSVAFQTNGTRSYTHVVRDALLARMRADRRVVVITAAMCQGTMLEPVRKEFPERFFDVGICESHAVALAGGLAKAGLRPVVDIYSTFMQRSYDQVFQEVALQDLPVVLMLDRSGLVGPDGPTHHGVFDLSYLRPLPNLVVLAPGDAEDLPLMIDWALATTTRRPFAIRRRQSPGYPAA
jgi:1-deoxy-D-xylulose-5-phosphate synthase